MSGVAAGERGISAATRAQLYLALNGVFGLYVLIATFSGPAYSPRTLYLWLLMGLCSLPLLWMERLNGRYTLLGVFLAAYFVFYGANDAAGLLSTRATTSGTGVLSLAEFAILAGAALSIVGYRCALAAAGRPSSENGARDWPMTLIISTGLAFWCVGTLTDGYWQLNFTSTDSFDGRNSSVMVVLVIARMLQPLGTIMLGYALVVTRNRPLLLLVLALMVVQMLVGFIGNSKETAMRGLIILTMAAFLVHGRLPKTWMALGIAFVVLAFPIFQAYRAEVIGVRGMTRTAAARDIGRSIDLALGARRKVQSGYSDEYVVPSFLERSALKPTLEMLIAETGGRAQFQHGYTIALYFTGFVPRIIWPTKPDSSVGKLVNKEFRVSEDPNTYISATHLGELYWNFGWPGIIAGMFAFGWMLGFVNSKCDLSQQCSLTRLLVLITTIYATIVRFEGSIALEYIVFTRSLAIIGLLHLLCARVPVSSTNPASAASGRPPRIFAPQLLR